METLTDLLFELSNGDRLQILLELLDEPKNLSKIAKNLDFTAQGTSRNVVRLMQTSLITRNNEGDYQLTTYGETALKLLNSYEFISQEKEYLLSHRIDRLPAPFIPRLGELSRHESVNDLLDATANLERELKECMEYVWYITPGRIMSHRVLNLVTEALERGVKIRAIERTNYSPSAQVMETVPKEVLGDLERHWKLGNIQTRYLDEVNLRLYVTEKEVALLAFPRLDGEIDVRGFQSHDRDFHGWCSDLFEYYWQKAKQVPWFWTMNRKQP